MRRLTDQQRDWLTENPRWIAYAFGFARRFSCYVLPIWWDDIRSAALLGLVDAAASYDASHGASFKTYAARRIRGSILDTLRMLVPAGYRRSAEHGPEQDLEASAALTAVHSSDLEVGWELESADAVESKLAGVPQKNAAVLRSYFLVAGTTFKGIGEALGISEPCVSQRYHKALEIIREPEVAATTRTYRPRTRQTGRRTRTGETE